MPVHTVSRVTMPVDVVGRVTMIAHTVGRPMLVDVVGRLPDRMYVTMAVCH